MKTVLIKDSSKEKLLLKYIIAKQPPTQVKIVNIVVDKKTNFLLVKYLLVSERIALICLNVCIKQKYNAKPVKGSKKDIAIKTNNISNNPHLIFLILIAKKQ